MSNPSGKTSNGINVGIDLGGTSVRVGAYNNSWELLTLRSFSTRVADGPQAVITDMAGAVQSICNELKASPAGVGIGSPGPLNLVEGSLGLLPNFPGWDGFPLRASLEEALQLPVVLESDANAAALAEWKLGVGRTEQVDSMAMLTLGTGVGTGLILKGSLWSGMVGMGGELGHVSVEPDGLPCSCGTVGCLEKYASATAIRVAATGSNSPELKKLFAEKPEASAREIAALAESGDPAAREIYKGVGRHLGLGLAMLANTLDLPLYVIGGGVAQAWSLFAPEMFETLRQYSIVYRLQLPAALNRREKNRPFVTSAQLGAESGLIGAAMLESHTRQGLLV